MDSSTCISKSELLDWLRERFHYNIVKVEECGNGVLYLMIMDSLYPGKVPMRKIKQNAKQEWECLHNLKLLQNVFLDQGIKKNLDINRLAKCVYSDNLEFLQWLKRFYDRTHPSQGEGSNEVGSRLDTTQTEETTTTSLHSRKPHRLVTATDRHDATFHRMKQRSALPTVVPSRCQPTVHRKDLAVLEEELEKYRSLVKKRDEEIENLLSELRDTEAESRFYFGKLRALEMLAAEPQRKGFTIPEVETILFSEENFSEEELIKIVLNRDTSHDSGALHAVTDNEKTPLPTDITSK